MDQLFVRSNILESDNDYKEVYITIQLTEESNKLLSESAKRSKRGKIQEVKLRLEDHLSRFRSISELNQTTPHEVMDADHGRTKNL